MLDYRRLLDYGPECLLPYLCMVTVPHILVGLERMLDYRGVGLVRNRSLRSSNKDFYTLRPLENHPGCC